jgi:hypothetical protein
MSALFEGFDEKLGKWQEDEKEEKTPQEDDTEEKNRILKQFLESVTGIEFNGGRRHRYEFRCKMKDTYGIED